MTYEVLYAFRFEAIDDDDARLCNRSILQRLGDVARNQPAEIEPRAFVDEQGRDIPLSRPGPGRPALIDPETSRTVRNEIRLRLQSSGLRVVDSGPADEK